MHRRDGIPIDDKTFFDDETSFDDDDGERGQSWYYSEYATTIKYGILFALLSIGFLVIFGSWAHARQRMRNGQPPLLYHRVCGASLVKAIQHA